MTVDALVTWIILTCGVNPQNIDDKLTCIDKLNNCMVGYAGQIKEENKEKCLEKLRSDK